MNQIEKVIERINNVDIVVLENEKVLVPIKPICDCLGIDHSAQVAKIKEHPIYSSTMGMNTTVAADGKDREMFSIEFEFIFGWLLSIDSRKVNPEAKEAVLKYQLECHKALYNYFTQKGELNKIKQEQDNQKAEDLRKLTQVINEKKQLLSDYKKESDSLRSELKYLETQRDQLIINHNNPRLF